MTSEMTKREIPGSFAGQGGDHQPRSQQSLESGKVQQPTKSHQGAGNPGYVNSRHNLTRDALQETIRITGIPTKLAGYSF